MKTVHDDFGTYTPQLHHLHTYGTKCPVCMSHSISGGSVEIDKMQAVQGLSCANCGSSWEDVFQRTSFQSLTVGRLTWRAGQRVYVDDYENNVRGLGTVVSVPKPIRKNSIIQVMLDTGNAVGACRETLRRPGIGMKSTFIEFDFKPTITYQTFVYAMDLDLRKLGVQRDAAAGMLSGCLNTPIKLGSATLWVVDSNSTCTIRAYRPQDSIPLLMLLAKYFTCSLVSEEMTIDGNRS